MQLQRLRGIIIALKDMKIIYRQTGMSQICPQLKELEVKIIPSRCPACSNMARLFGEHIQTKAVTKTEWHNTGRVQTMAGSNMKPLVDFGSTEWHFLEAPFASPVK